MPSSLSFRSLLVLVAVVFAVCVPTAQAASETDWIQYRGPGGQGAAAGAAWAQDASSLGLAVEWKQKLGSAYSSLIIADGRVITFFSEGDHEILVALDATSGKELWRHGSGDKYGGHDGSHDGALSTPTVVGEHVIAFHPTGRLFAVKASSGELVWEKDVKEVYGANPPFYGFAASPIVVGDDRFVLQVGGAEGTVVAFDGKSGKELWKIGGDNVAYQSPTVMEYGGKPMLVAPGVKNLYGIDPANGSILWQIEYSGSASGFGAGGATPVPAGPGRVFVTHKSDSSIMIALKEVDGKIVPEVAWENRNIRNSYDAPVYHEGFLYGYSSRFLVCVDAASGEARWKSRTPGDGALTLVSDYLVILTKEGSTHVAKANPEAYEELAGLEVFTDHVWSAPSYAGGAIYARSLGEVARIGLSNRKTRVIATTGDKASLAATRFGAFLKKVESSDNKQAAVDAFMAKLEQTPFVEQGWVHFLYKGDANDVAVGGDLTEIEREARMERVDDTDLFYSSHRLESDARLNYVLFVDFEQQLDPRNPRSVDVAVMGNDLTLSFSPDTIEMSWFSMPDWKTPTFLTAADSKSNGSLNELTLTSKIAERDINLSVYLPSNYDANSDARYPVIYIHNGQAALKLGLWQHALDQLAGKSSEPVIAVFVGPDGGQGPQRTQILADEVVPMIDEKYRTRADRDSRANMGAGVAANSALFATFGRPDVFGRVAAQGAFMTEFAWNPLFQLLPEKAEPQIRAYIDWGKYDMRNAHENWDLGEDNAKLLDTLKQRGFDVHGGAANDGTGWASWRNRTDEVLAALFPK